MESNPKKFNLDAAELSKRKAFITSTRETVKVKFQFKTHLLTCSGDTGSGLVWSDWLPTVSLEGNERTDVESCCCLH